MDAPPPAVPKPCYVCGDKGGQHCTKCKSRHYCSKACQLFDWKEGGHKEQCKQLAAKFQDRLLDELMPEKLKIKEEPPIVEAVALATGSNAATRLPADQTQTTAVVKATALNGDAPDWRGTCAICLDLMPVNGARRAFYTCCCETICKECHVKCRQHDDRCPLCRTPSATSAVEDVRRLQKHVDRGNAEAQMQLGLAYHSGDLGLKKSLKRAVQLFERAAAQEYAIGQSRLGNCYETGEGVKINFKTAAQLFRRAAEQGLPEAQSNLGQMFYHGKGVAQSYDEAVRWFRLAAAQGLADAFYNLGSCYATGLGAPQDLDEAVRFYKCAAAKGCPGAAEAAQEIEVRIATTRSG